MSGGATRVAYLCWPNGRSLHNVGRSLVGPMARHGVAVDVVDSRAWFERPTPADVNPPVVIHPAQSGPKQTRAAFGAGGPGKFCLTLSCAGG